MSTVPTLESYLNRITSEYRNQPNFVAYVTALVQPLIDSQALLRSLLTTFDLDTAIGVQLDAVGQWIGRSRYLEQPLNGVYFSFDTTGLGFDQGTWFGPFDALDGLTSLDDTTYRALLYAKRIMNNWDGTIPGIASAIAALLAGTSPGSTLSVVDNQDMSMTVAISGQVPPAAIIALLQGGYVPVVPSGVGPNYLITSVNLSALFGFDVENSTISGFDVGAFAGAVGAGPGPVSGFALVSLTATTATFSWLPPATGTGPFTYQLQDQVDAGIGGLFNLIGLPVSTTTATIAVSPGHSYAFQVYAINSSGPGTPSATLDFNTAAATNVNASATVQLPALMAAVSGTVQGFQIVATVSLLPLTVSARAFTGVVARASIVFSAVGRGSDAVIGMATLATIVARAVIVQSGQGFVSSGLSSVLAVKAKATAAVGAGPIIVINPILGATQAGSFTVSGTMSGMLSVPSLSYIDDASLTTITGVSPTETATTLSLTWSPDTDPALTSIPSAGVTQTQFTFAHPALVAGTHTLLVTNGSVSTTITYTVGGSGAVRNWAQYPGADGMYWSLPMQTTANIITSGALITALRQGTPNVRQPANYCVPWVVGTTNDPECTVSDGTNTITVRIPVGTVAENIDTGDDSLGGTDSTQPYLGWTANGVLIDGSSGNATRAGSVITCSGMQVYDCTGPVMEDAVTGLTNTAGSDNAIGNLPEFELQAALSSGSYVPPHTIACSLDFSQVNSNAHVWPIINTDTGNTGPIPEGVTICIPHGTVRPIGQTRGFYLLWDILQQFGMLVYNVNGSGAISCETYPVSAPTIALSNDMNASFPTVMASAGILAYDGSSGSQTSASTAKGMVGGVRADAFPAPALIDLSDTGGIHVLPSTFGAWYATNLGNFYNTSVGESAQGATLTGTTGTIYDSSLNAWTLGSSPIAGQAAYENGTIAGNNFNTTLILYWNRSVYLENSSGQFFQWNGSGYNGPLSDPR